MTANEIYKWPHISVSKDIYSIMEFMGLDNYLLKEDANQKVELRHYIDHNIDGERYIEMFSVWFDNYPKSKFANEPVPVMICQIAGRGGRDCREFFITDASLYKDMVAYVRSLLEIEEENIDVTDPNVDVPQLTQFYGIEASDLYDPNLEPKYKAGDIVIARVIKDHLKMMYSSNKEYVETRCKITSVNPKDPDTTYHMWQLDRRWENEAEKKARGYEGFTGEMVFDKDNGGVGASGNDQTIIGLAN